MTIVHVLVAFFLVCAVLFCGYALGVMRGFAEGRTKGYQACLGAIDEDEAARKVWRASK